MSSPHITRALPSSSLLYESRSSTKSNRRYLAEEIMVEENDTLCLLPSSMRCLCMLLTLLLILSLGAAIFNSLQGASVGSKSYCKMNEEKFHPKFLCPNESMFIYYSCCSDDTKGTVSCCSQFKLWLLFAIACVGMSFVIGIVYTILNIVRNLRNRRG